MNTRSALRFLVDEFAARAASARSVDARQVGMFGDDSANAAKRAALYDARAQALLEMAEEEDGRA